MSCKIGYKGGPLSARPTLPLRAWVFPQGLGRPSRDSWRLELAESSTSKAVVSTSAFCCLLAPL